MAQPTTTAANLTMNKLEPRDLPDRIVLNAVEGWGKTTAGAHAPGAAILMARGETGYETLLRNSRVPSVPAAYVQDWPELLLRIESLTKEPGEIRTLIFDALGGFERLCHEFVCRRDFNGDWGERGFLSYNKGYDLSVADWLDMLARLDRLRNEHHIGLVLLSHCKIKTFKNPMGEDYDRYVSDVHDKTWAATAKWCDAVFFGNFFSVVEKDSPKARKGKGIGGADRVLYAERRDAFDAKNRHGMEPIIDIPDDPALVWATIEQAMRQESK